MIGKVLTHGDRSGVIVETEAYLGPEDAASHARFGQTARNAVMFGPGGIAYVYLCYGVHNMFNVVTGAPGDVGAVLIRAVSPLRGLADDPGIGRGPGKLCKALGITRAHHGCNLTDDSSTLYLAHAPAHGGAIDIATGPRVGIDYAGDWASTALRFWHDGHAAVSRPPRKRQRALA